MEPLVSTDAAESSERVGADEKATAFDSKASLTKPENGRTTSAWRKVATVAGASAILGGLAAAWWYRSTLLKLRQAEESDPHPDFGTAEEEPAQEE
jgi:hypothetical protein